jgi:hypothetical protein
VWLDGLGLPLVHRKDVQHLVDVGVLCLQRDLDRAGCARDAAAQIQVHQARHGIRDAVSLEDASQNGCRHGLVVRARALGIVVEVAIVLEGVLWHARSLGCAGMSGWLWRLNGRYCDVMGIQLAMMMQEGGSLGEMGG